MKRLVFILAVILILGISLLAYPSDAIAGRKLIGKWQAFSGILRGPYIQSILTAARSIFPQSIGMGAVA
jgi:hypothetical protein